MGTRGPVPARSSDRRRRNKPADAELLKAPSGPAVETPAPDPEWHPIARDWFTSLGVSGQARFYQASDWATARYVAEAMSRNLSAGRFSAQLFAAVMAASSGLMVTEGDRRRLRLELERASDGEVPVSPVASLDAYRDAL